MIVHIHFDGDPLPCPRPRVGKRGTYYPAPYANQKRAWGLLARSQVNGGGFVNDERLTALLLFRRSDRRRIDGDNLSKSVTDALNGIVYGDDSQIDRWVIDIQRGAGDDAGVDAWFYPYTPRRAFVLPAADNWVGA